MAFLFSKTKDLVAQIDNFIDIIAQANLHFKESLRLYFENRMEEFENKFNVVRDYENQADDLRKDIEVQLYRQTLIPESRGDVLGILENMDSIIDRCKLTLLEFSIEKPEVPEEIKKFLMELTDSVILSVEALTFAARAFFYDINAVKDHLYKVKFYEKEADIMAEKIKRDIFNMDIHLCNKLHLKSFVYHIDKIADYAEEVSNRIAIAAIKRII